MGRVIQLSDHQTAIVQRGDSLHNLSQRWPAGSHRKPWSRASPVSATRECVRRTDPANWAAAWRSLKELDVQGKLAGFEPPTLVFAGGKDVSGPTGGTRHRGTRQVPGQSVTVRRWSTTTNSEPAADTESRNFVRPPQSTAGLSSG